MTSNLRKLWAVVDEEGRRRLVRLAAMMAAGSVLEAVGIGLVLPYLSIITEPASFFAHPWGRAVADGIGFARAEPLMIGASALLALLYVGKNLFIALQWRAVYGFLFGRTVELSRRLLEGYLHAPFTFHLQRDTADLVRNTTTECGRVYDGAVRSALELGAETLVAAGLVIVLFAANAAAAAVVLGLMGLVGWGLTVAYRSRLREAGAVRAERQSSIIRAVEESLGGVKEVTLLGREDHFVGAFRENAAALADARREEAVVRKYPRLVLETAAVAVMVGLAGVVVFTEATVLSAVPLAGLFGVATVRLMPSLNRMVDNFNQLRYEAPAVDIVHRELERTRRWSRAAGERAAAGGVEPLRLEERLEVDGVSYRYADRRGGEGEGDGGALRDVSLAVEAGSRTAVVGPSGSGKTTLVNVVLGLLEPDEGAVRVDGTDVRADLPAWQRSIGYIPQDIYLADTTLAGNVAYGLPAGEADAGRVRAALETARLGDFVDGLPDGLETPVGERGVRLSGGQRQRVAIARALYHDPDVLVLDEATSSLDYRTEREVMEAVEAGARDRTVIFVTHRLGTVRDFDVLHLLEEGRRVATGDYDELVEASARFRQLALEG